MVVEAVLWVLLATVNGREVILDTFTERPFCETAVKSEFLSDRAKQIDERSIKCWPYDLRRDFTPLSLDSDEEGP